MRKLILILCWGVCCSQLCGLALAGEVKGSRPSMAADSYQWDFGKVKEGEVLKHDFLLKNESSDILEIANIHTSCGCIAAQAEKKSLLPQGSTTITATLDTQGYAGKPIKQSVYVHTDSADLSILKYTVTAEVVKK
jgi:hypothetical protein